MSAPAKAARWEWRNRGGHRWEALREKPDHWWMQMEYRALDDDGNEIWRTGHVNGYEEKP